MPITELTPFHVGLIMDHFLNDCEIRYWFMPDKDHDATPKAYINLANYYTANNELIAMGILECVNHLPEAQGPLQAIYQDGRQAYATRITDMGKAMFSLEHMASRAVN